MKLKRCICLYEKYGEDFIDEIIIDIDISILREIINYNSDDYELYDGYPINSDLANEFNKYINVKWDFEKYDYFLQCYEIK